MTRTSEVAPIFTFSLTKGTAPSLKSNLPTSGKGFLSTSTAIELVPGSLLVISIGTTAPFSAISGASMTSSPLGAAFAAPMPFSASAADFAPNASLFQAASAAHGLSSIRVIAPSRVLRKRFMLLFYRPPVLAGLAAAFLLEPKAAERHAAVERLDHVVDREQSHRRRGQRLHLDPGLAVAFDGGLNFNRGGCFFQTEIDGDAGNRDRMRQRDQPRRALGGQDRGNARDAEHVALLRAAASHHAEGGRLHGDPPRGHRDAPRDGLLADVHHVRGTPGVEMSQCRGGFCPRIFPLAARIFTHGGRYHKLIIPCPSPAGSGLCSWSWPLAPSGRRFLRENRPPCPPSETQRPFPPHLRPPSPISGGPH